MWKLLVVPFQCLAWFLQFMPQISPVQETLLLIFAMFLQSFSRVPRQFCLEELSSPTSLKILITYAIVHLVTWPLVGLPDSWGTDHFLLNCPTANQRTEAKIPPSLLFARVKRICFIGREISMFPSRVATGIFHVLLSISCCSTMALIVLVLVIAIFPSSHASHLCYTNILCFLDFFLPSFFSSVSVSAQFTPSLIHPWRPQI